ncbi:MAG: DUF2344 domain-containing protein [Proteobacteria bacterium]|nr:DUF2344 domain-containing protein [Pseudomonadota bacterium]
MRVDIEKLLPHVEKPGRYLGHEENIVLKEKARVKMALAYPDVYEIGMSNQGIQVLYHVINDLSEYLCERVFAPAKDMEKLMRETDTPLFSLETKSRISDFDLFGFTLEYELDYVNILTMLDLANIPFKREERGEGDPIIIAGGSCVYNPLPVKEICDLFFIGEAEEGIIEILDIIAKGKDEKAKREEILKRLAEVEGVYVPGISRKVVRRSIPAMKYEYIPLKPIVPLINITQNRMTLEIARGCTRGCRFCQAGIIYRPVREIPEDEALRATREIFDNTGFDEISLLSLSASDYRGLKSLMFKLMEQFRQKRVSVSLPSLRIETLDKELLNLIKNVRKSSITVAIEAATQRLRDVINKDYPEDSIERGIDLAFQLGWKRVKLYFMIGLPTETDEDILAIPELLNKIGSRWRRKSIKVTISPFIPRPFTPFEREQQISMDEVKRRENMILHNLRARNVSISFREPEVAFLEGVFARGDEKLNDVLIDVWKSGERMSAWTETFDYSLWKKAFTKNNIKPEIYLNKIDEGLPWGFMEFVDKKFLEKEYENAKNGKTTSDCRRDVCHVCGLCDGSIAGEMKRKVGEEYKPFVPRKPKVRLKGSSYKPRIRIRYRKSGVGKFISHLDTIRLFKRAIIRTNLPVKYSEGFNPKMNLAFGPPLPIGVTGINEYFDMELEYMFSDDLVKSIDGFLPDFLQLKQGL